jgi:hypothetical protein
MRDNQFDMAAIANNCAITSARGRSAAMVIQISPGVASGPAINPAITPSVCTEPETAWRLFLLMSRQVDRKRGQPSHQSAAAVLQRDVVVQVYSRESGKQPSDRNLALEPRQRRSEAVVNAVAEREVRVRSSGQV